mgnify:CR=1 FL=1
MSMAAEALRDRLEGAGLIVAPGAYDGLSARLVERAGFPAVYLTGGGVSRSFGRPDIGATTLGEVVERARSVVSVTTLPVIADLDAGHGGVAMLMRAVREMEAAGVAAVHIEDREVPRRYRNNEDNMLPVDDMAGRVRAAFAVRSRNGILIIARTDSAPVEGLDRAIDRANAYADAGADVIYVEHLRTRAEMETVARRVAAPKLVSLNKGSGETPPAAELEQMGYRILTLPADLQLAAIHAMQNLLSHVAEFGSTAQFDEMISFAARDEIVGLDEARAREDDFLPVGRPPAPGTR